MLKCWNGTSLFFSTKIWYFGYFFATIKHIYFLIIVAEADSNLAQVIIFLIRCSQYLVRYLGKLKMEILKHVVVLLYILEKVLCKPGVPVFIILERHCNIVMWYYHMPRVSQLTMFLLFLITVQLNARIPQKLASWTLSYTLKWMPYSAPDLSKMFCV